MSIGKGKCRQIRRVIGQSPLVGVIGGFLSACWFPLPRITLRLPGYLQPVARKENSTVAHGFVSRRHAIGCHKCAFPSRVDGGSLNANALRSDSAQVPQAVVRDLKRGGGEECRNGPAINRSGDFRERLRQRRVNRIRNWVIGIGWVVCCALCVVR